MELRVSKVRGLKAGNDERNVPNNWTVKDGGVGGEMSILFQTVGKSRKILKELFKNRALTDKLLF